MNQSSRNNRERSWWALSSIVLVLILFGCFWFWQNSAIEKESAFVVPLEETAQNQKTTEDTSEEEIDFSTLEANAVNIPVPDFESFL